MIKCKICGAEFGRDPDSLVLCDHHESFVHYGCCVDRCSQDKKPCRHAKGFFDRRSSALG